MRTRTLSILVVLVALGLGSSAPAQFDCFVTTTNYEIVGATSRIGIDGGYPVSADEYVIHSDAVVRAHGAQVYVINRLFADNILVLDAANGYSVVTQYSVAASGLNPRDIAVVNSSLAYVTLYEGNDLLVCNPLSGAVIDLIDLSSFADGDGIVEMDQMARVGDRLFVALQNLDRRVSPWAITGLSTIAVIDVPTNSLVDVDPETPGIQGIALQTQNPYWRLRYEPISGKLLVIGAGSFQSRDGGLERINAFSLQSEGVVIDEQTLGGELLDVAWVSESLAWAVINDAQFNTCVLRFDPSTSSLIDTVMCTNGFLISDIELSSDGRIFVSDRTPSAPGVRVYDAATATLLSGPINVGLPPFDLVMIEGAPTSAPLPQWVARLEAAPNPFNPRVTIRLTPWSDSALPVLRIIDTRGRLVRRLAGDREAGAAAYVWDGRDERGRPAASGTYRALSIGVPLQPIALTLVR